jgi:hypothetical protein
MLILYLECSKLELVGAGIPPSTRTGATGMTGTQYSIHADVQIDWNRRVRDVRVLDTTFNDRDSAQRMLNAVRRTMPRAFIKRVRPS